MQPKISVIIPVYGVEKYIEECLVSVINQTLREIEIIVVNDGTKDNSIKIVEKYIFDKRIKIINKENGGLSSARNAGIKKAQGKYIYNLDGDDFLAKNILEKIYNYAEKNKLDVVIFDINMYDDKNKKILTQWKDTNFLEGKIYCNIQYLKEYFLGKGCPSVCNKLFKKELYLENSIFHPENISYGEDGATMTRLLSVSSRIGKVNQSAYYYRQIEESMMKKNIKIMEYLVSYNITINFLKKQNLENELEKYFDTYKFYCVYRNLLKKAYSKKLDEDYQKVYKQFFIEIKKMKIYNLSIKYKILVYLFKINKKLANIVLILFRK